MLVLSRNIDESIMIGDDVQVTVKGIKGPNVQLGVHAPKDVTVHRQEVAKRIQHERSDHAEAAERCIGERDSCNAEIQHDRAESAGAMEQSIGAAVGHLVLARKRNQSIVIGGNTVVTIVDIRGDQVRLGIEAPQEVPVHRQEVYEAIKRESE